MSADPFRKLFVLSDFALKKKEKTKTRLKTKSSNFGKRTDLIQVLCLKRSVASRNCCAQIGVNKKWSISLKGASEIGW